VFSEISHHSAANSGGDRPYGLFCRALTEPKNRKDTMEPIEASRGLHTQEVTGSSPVAPTIKITVRARTVRLMPGVD